MPAPRVVERIGSSDSSLPRVASAGSRADGGRFELVLLAAVTWNFPLVGRSRMLTEAWQRRGQPVTFVQVPSLRSALQRLAAPVSRGPAHVVRPWSAYPFSLWPHLPESLLRRSARLWARELRRQLTGRIDWSRAAAVVVSPIWAPWLRELPFGKVIYDCIDDVAVHTPRPALAALYRRWEDELVGRASGAVVTSETLLAALRARRPELPAATIRNGVDAERFVELARGAPRPADLPDDGRPIVGFVGALYEWVDQRLIAAVARALPDFHFVFVGPQGRRGLSERLRNTRNVRFLGRRPYERVPAYVAAFDVCWVPFDHGRIARAANPVKVYEYLALGKPVVSTPIADVDSFDPHVRVGHDVGEVVAQLRAAAGEPDGRATQRMQFARANSWDSRAAQYLDFIGTLAR